MIRFALVLAMLALPATLAAQEVPRTFYASLDLSSPQATADTFLSAYARSDYETVYATLSPQAQQDFVGSVFRLFDVSGYFAGQGQAFLRSTTLGRDSPTFEEFTSMPDMIFDDIMVTAEGDAVLPFTVAADFATTLALTSVDPPRAVATVETHATPPVVSLELLQLPSGRWKVDRITWEGSDHRLRPWGVAPGLR